MTCATCRYCRDRDEAMGICRRNPPLARGGFPMVMLTDWCGEWTGRGQLSLSPPIPEMEPEPVKQPEPVEAPKRWWERVIG